MASAAQSLLEQLHADFASTLADILKKGVPVKDEESGEVFYAPPPPATLNVIRQFLKDNDIEGAQDAVKGLLSAGLPPDDFESDSTVVPFPAPNRAS